jgi:hypothetical protein
VARTWSLVIIAITLAVTVAHIVAPEAHDTDYPPVENLLPLLMLLSIMGLAVAWRWEGVGGAMNVVLFLAHFGLYWALRGRFFPLGGLAMFSAVIVPGVLFLVCWWRRRRRGRKRTPE